MNVFFLAAGLGTRLRPLTDRYPKPCVPFLNVPMGLYPFRFLEQLEISSCVVNSFHLPEKIEQLYSTPIYYRNKIQLSKESGLILGSAGGLKKASELFSDDETILMLNADEIFFTQDKLFLQKAYRQHVSSGNLATLIVTKHPEAGKKFGAIWTDDLRVKNIGKTNSDRHLQPLHYIGIIFLSKKVLASIPTGKETNIFYDILIHELDKNRVEVYPLECSWYETGNPIDYLAATKNVLGSIDEETLAFINRYDPSRLIKNTGGVSLVSDSISIDEKKLFGFNVVAKSTNLNTLNSAAKIENSVRFDNEVLTF